MSERSGIHLTGADSGWPVAATAEADPKKTGDLGGDDGNPHADSVANGIVTTSTSTNEVQTVTVDATSGTYKLAFMGRETAAIAENASAATVKAALELGTNLNEGDITVTGSAGGPYTITFVGPDYANKNVDALVATSIDLAGGTGVSVATTTGGSP